MIGDIIEAETRVRGSQIQIGFYRRFAKRLIDIVLVMLAMPAVIPIMIVLAILIRADGGPAFYSQERVGLGGRTFRMWKLRSMVVDADQMLQQLLDRDPDARQEWEDTQKLKRDPRITPIGQAIRKTSLDELPQVWNVLIGDMSLVGPRPFLPEQRSLYAGRDYYELRPGLTGPWQVNDRNGTSFSARATYDSQYYERLSLRTDAQILLETLSVVLRGTGY
jgi:exopolysaccharide production protein ExoY